MSRLRESPATPSKLPSPPANRADRASNHSQAAAHRPRRWPWRSSAPSPLDREQTRPRETHPIRSRSSVSRSSPINRAATPRALSATRMVPRAASPYPNRMVSHAAVSGIRHRRTPQRLTPKIGLPARPDPPALAFTPARVPRPSQSRSAACLQPPRPIRSSGENHAPAAHPRPMLDFDSRPLLTTGTVTLWDVVCAGTCRHKSPEECASATHLVFPYRGIFVRTVGHAETVAEANQVLFFNEDEPYQVSHPVAGGDFEPLHPHQHAHTAGTDAPRTPPPQRPPHIQPPPPAPRPQHPGAARAPASPPPPRTDRHDRSRDRDI